MCTILKAVLPFSLSIVTESHFCVPNLIPTLSYAVSTYHLLLLLKTANFINSLSGWWWLVGYWSDVGLLCLGQVTTPSLWLAPPLLLQDSWWWVWFYWGKICACNIRVERGREGGRIMKLPEVADEVVSSCEVDQWSGYDVVSEGSSIIVHNPLSY